MEPVRLGSLLLISTTPIRYIMGHGQALGGGGAGKAAARLPGSLTKTAVFREALP